MPTAIKWPYRCSLDEQGWKGGCFLFFAPWCLRCARQSQHRNKSALCPLVSGAAHPVVNEEETLFMFISCGPNPVTVILAGKLPSPANSGDVCVLSIVNSCKSKCNKTREPEHLTGRSSAEPLRTCTVKFLWIEQANKHWLCFWKLETLSPWLQLCKKRPFVRAGAFLLFLYSIWRFQPIPWITQKQNSSLN